MNRQAVAQELVKVARLLVGFEFPNREEMEKYLKEHPGADKSKHYVTKETHPSRHHQMRQNVQQLESIGKHYSKEPEALTNDEIEQYNKGKQAPAAAPARGDYDFDSHVRDLVTTFTKQHNGISHPKLVEILGRFGNKKPDIEKGLKSLEKDGYMKKDKSNRWRWNLKGEF